MQGSSGDTQFTFNDNPAAPAEGVSQSSPGTADSGSKSTMSKSTMSGWSMTGHQRRATASTPKSARDGARSGTRQRGHRSPRRPTTRPGTPRAIEDRPGRTRDDGRIKRRTTETSGSREPIAIIDELRAQCQSLQEKMAQMELYAASRDQLIKDIEVKFTDYLRTHNQNVHDEFNTLNQRLTYSTDEVAEYQAELMVASQEDEGATLRIEELERRGAIMENGAMRIHQRGMEIQEEYKDEVSHLRGLLGNTESRLQQMQYNSDLATNVAEKLFQEGREMQAGFENSIVEYRIQSELASYSHTHLEMPNQHRIFEVKELMDENSLMSEALMHSRKQAELYEHTMEQITRDYRKKVHEANQAKIENDLRHRNTEHDAMKRFEAYRNAESEAIARLRHESNLSMSANSKMEHYEKLYENEHALNDELRAEVKDRETKLRRSLKEDPAANGQGPNRVAIEHLESQTKIAQIRAQDLVVEVGECMSANLRLKEESTEVPKLGPPAHFGSEVAVLRSELESERKLKLASGAQQYERSCEYMGELRDRDENLKLKNSEIQAMKRNIDDLRRSLKDAEIIIKAQGNSNMLPYSAGIPSTDPSSRSIIEALENEVSAANTEMTVLRAWNWQLDEALNEETNAANAGNVPDESVNHQPQQPGQRVADLLRDVDRKIAAQMKAQGFDVKILFVLSPTLKHVG